ncbi:MAG: S8 family serine peptidase [Opitutales bacterium]
MKKKLLPGMLGAVLAGLVVWFAASFDDEKGPEGPDAHAPLAAASSPETANIAAPGPIAQSPLSPSRPLEGPARPREDAGESTGSHLPGSLLTRYYADMPILEVKSVPMHDPRYRRQVTHVETNLKYSQVRVEDILYQDPETGETRVVESVAMAANHVLLEPRNPQEANNYVAALDRDRFRIRSQLSFSGAMLVRVPERETLEAFEPFIQSLREEFGEGAVVEPDYLVYPATPANDPSFQNGDLWNLRNTGQNEGTRGADISATEAWDIRTDAGDIVIGVVDTGTRLTHEDLAGNLWVNPGEVVDGTDSDGNGIVDDIHGFDAIEGSGNPEDEDGHGTHVAGIAGAVGNNGVGVTGVAWNVQLMTLRFLTNSGGFTSDAIEAIDYGRVHGADILNNSWGGGFFSTPLRNAIARARDEGILFVAAAGNEGRDNDTTPLYPSSYDLDNIISVASSDRRDDQSGFSNYGATSVNLAAPGSSIRSTFSRSDSSYAVLSGTSMAAPHVSGALAILKAELPGKSAQELKARLLDGVDILPAFAEITTTGGRLNLLASLLDETVPRPGIISFADFAATVGETAGELAITVNRTAGSDGAVSVRYETVDDSAKAGEHFVSIENAVLRWEDGDRSERIINIPIFEDSETEGPTTFFVELSRPRGGAMIGTLDTIEITILDRDSASLEGFGFEEAREIVSPAFGGAPVPDLAVAPDDSYSLVEIEFDDSGAPRLSLRRFDTEGNPLWETKHESGLGVFQPRAAIGPSGRTIVAYSRILARDNNFIQRAGIAVASFDSDGQLLWDRKLEGASDNIDLPNDITVDPGGHIYVGGEHSILREANPYLAKVDTEGNLSWLDTSPPEGGERVDNAINSIALDSESNLFAGGWTIAEAGFTGLLLKYGPDGNRLLTREFPALEQQRVLSIAVNAFDELFLGLRAFNNSSGAFNGKLVKVSPQTGRTIWQRAESIGDAAPNFLIAVSPNGMINYAEAPLDLSENVSEYSIGQFDRDGNKRFENTLDAVAPLTLTAFAGRSDGGIILSGAFQGLAQFGADFLDSGDDPGLFVSRLSLQDELMPGILELEADTFSVPDSAGSIEITIRRSGGFDGAVAVTVNTVEGDAVAGEDFVPVNGKRIDFTPGQQSASFQIGILENPVAAPDKAFQVVLEDPTGGAGLGKIRTATVTIINSSFGFQAWLREHFTDEELKDPDITGELADPDGDGLVNVIEYAFALDPTRASAPPEIRIVDVTEETTTVFYLRGQNRDDLDFEVQGSSDLAHWTTLDEQKSTATAAGETKESVEARFEWPLDDGEPRFVRITIEQANQRLGDRRATGEANP